MCCLCIQFTHENTSERTILIWLLALQKRLATPLLSHIFFIGALFLKDNAVRHNFEFILTESSSGYIYCKDLFLIVLNSLQVGIILGVMVFDATFKNISVLSWRSVLLLEETRVTGANVVSSTPLLSGIAYVVINPTTIRSKRTPLYLRE